MTLHVVPPLGDVCDEAAASQEVRDYLKSRGILTVGTLALLASDEATLQNVLIDPLLAGWRQAGASILLQESEKPIATAMIRHMWGVCRRHWTASMAHTPTSSTPASTSTPSTSKPAADDKPPKTLPAGVWGTLVNNYNKIQLDGRDRVFPTHILVGAEGVLARLYHEHTHSHLYTPLLLGEILQHRSFQSSGEVNPLAKQNKRTSSLKLEDGVLIEQDEKGWEPRSVLAILDGLEAASWATILVNLGPEHDVHRYIDWMTQRVRSRPNKTEQFNAYWTACSWKIAMGMREGQTFTFLVDTVMKDFDRFSDFMSREDTRQDTPIKKPAMGSKGKQPDLAKGYGKSPKGKQQQRSQPYGRPRWNDPYSTTTSPSSSWSSPSSWSRSPQHHQGSRWQPQSSYESWQGGLDYKDAKNK